MRSLQIFRATTAAALLISLISVAGCGSSGGTTGPITPPTLSLRQALNAALPATVYLPVELDTTASILVTLHMNGIKGAGAAFINGTSLVDGGNVWIRTLNAGAVDSVQLAKTVAGSGTLIIYSTLTGSPPPTVNIAFDGTSYHVFRVSGAGTIGGFVDSVKSVDDIDVSAPADNATLPRSGGLTVTWSDAGADANVKVAVKVVAANDSTKQTAATVVPDPDGTAVIPAAQLNTLPPGGAKLAVSRYRLAYKTDGGHNTGFACETITVLNLTLTTPMLPSLTATRARTAETRRASRGIPATGN
ncbi:MAG TPA: hypothetical protein VL123_06590 [Candidatus Udaeobacter sp.]|jgi:hypothetical protein|nr:hypothetical protein [Candidatus Udaeobacter sp.]